MSPATRELLDELEAAPATCNPDHREYLQATARIARKLVRHCYQRGVPTPASWQHLGVGLIVLRWDDQLEVTITVRHTDVDIRAAVDYIAARYPHQLTA